MGVTTLIWDRNFEGGGGAAFLPPFSRAVYKEEDWAEHIHCLTYERQ